MRPMTVTEKIIARATGKPEVTPGEEVWCNVDLAVMNDTSGPRRFVPQLDKLGGKVWDINKVVLAVDHFVPAANTRQAEILVKTRRWAEEQHMPHFYDSVGVLHNLLIDKFHALPGMLIAGADSHSLTAGAMGAVAVGISSTELASILATGQIWLSVPATFRIWLAGAFRPGITPRDLTMSILHELRGDFALDKAVEYAGPAIANLSVDQRLVLSNQSIEMGAENGIVPADERLVAEIKTAGKTLPYAVPYSDEDAEFAETRAFNLSQVESMVACPHLPENVKPVRELRDQAIDSAYIGSCVGGTFEDLAAAAQVLKGKRVKILLTITPATKDVYVACLQNGTLQTLLDAGAVIQAPGCGACAGLHSGLLAAGERCITTVTRNFRGRMGSPDAQIFIASPFTAAATALAGCVSDPREYL